MSHSCPTLPAFTGAGKVRSSGVSRRSRARGTWPAGSAWAGGQIIVKECGLRTDLWIIACCVIYFRFNYTHTKKTHIHDISWHTLLTRASMTQSYCSMQTVIIWSTPCQLRGGAVQPFCSEETACIASSSTKWMRMHDRISLLNVGPWFSWSAKFGYIFRVS